ncbi:MAG: FUSC family protein [Hyphomicrobiales bacterium]|nr:FUSC family protein [Hyphomicrobiales bacterium]
MQKPGSNGLAPWDIAYAVAMGVACAISYWIATGVLVRFVDEPTTLLGGMWSVVATVFVFRETRERTLSAGSSRLIATGVSFALCLVYLLIFPFTPLGMAFVIGLGTLVMTLLGRRDEIVTTGITTAVVLVVAGLSPEDAWRQPILRLIDTLIGMGVGVTCKWICSYGSSRYIGEPAR